MGAHLPMSKYLKVINRASKLLIKICSGNSWRSNG